jgi:hypothetical protein
MIQEKQSNRLSCAELETCIKRVPRSLQVPGLEGYRLECLRENPPVQDSVPKGRLRVAQHAVLGRVYERSPVPKGRLKVTLSGPYGLVGSHADTEAPPLQGPK